MIKYILLFILISFIISQDFNVQENITEDMTSTELDQTVKYILEELNIEHQEIIDRETFKKIFLRIY